MLHMGEQLQPAITGFTSDRCGNGVSRDDAFEYQEAHHIAFVGGYGSVFGDGNKVECDLCQDCRIRLCSKQLPVNQLTAALSKEQQGVA